MPAHYRYSVCMFIVLAVPTFMSLMHEFDWGDGVVTTTTFASFVSCYCWFHIVMLAVLVVRQQHHIATDSWDERLIAVQCLRTHSCGGGVQSLQGDVKKWKII